MEHWESLTGRSPVHAVARRSPFHAISQRDLTARGVVVLGTCALGGFATLSVRLAHDLGFAFGVFFVLVSLTCALAAGMHALFAPAVLPPLLMVAVVAAVAVLAPEAIDVDGLAAGASTVQRAIAGVIDHATALVLGHILALAAIALRVYASPRPGAQVDDLL